MKVLVASNLETDLDVMNGASGEVVDIILHPEEPTFRTESIVKLRYLPLYILIKLTRTRALRVQGLLDAVIPVEPMDMNMKIQVQTADGQFIPRTVYRQQYTITPGYAFTNYRVQGQTIPHVIVDIASLPSRHLLLFNLYVALLHSSGQSTIRLLRDFEDNLFIKPHDALLIEEDERLDKLDEKTKEGWLALHT